MPLVRRKKVLYHDVPLAVTNQPPGSQQGVYYIHQTGEVFDDYEAYTARMTFYSMKIFQCELTGKGALDFFSALDSERNEAATLHARFPEQLKGPVLQAVQWQIMGRLDNLVEIVYDRFVNRYFLGEKVFVDKDNDKYYARITKVFPPKSLTNGASSSTAPTLIQPHALGINLSIPVEESLARDDPMSYFYAVRLIDQSDPVTGELVGNEGPDSEKWAGSEMEVKANAMSRDRLSFSKSILRRFIRDCVDRDPAVASPWTVKDAIARQHGVATEMPEDVRRGIDGAKRGEKEKRKKVWEDKFEAEGGGSSKRRKKNEDGDIADAMMSLNGTSGNGTPVLEGTPGDVNVKPVPPPPTKPKGPIKYPTEDLDVIITEREKKLGKRKVRPRLERDLPFGPLFEPFLMSWSFMQSFGAPLKLSSFTLDDYEAAIRHSSDTPCNLIAEVNCCLMSVARERQGHKNLAHESIKFHESQAAEERQEAEEKMKEEIVEGEGEQGTTMEVDGLAAEEGVEGEEKKLRVEEDGDQVKVDMEVKEEGHGVPLTELFKASRSMGEKKSAPWDTQASKENGRPGWEDALVSFIRDHATIETLPTVRRIMTNLLFAPVSPDASSAASSGLSSESAASSAGSPAPAVAGFRRQTPAERYPHLSAEDKLAIINFFVDICIGTRAIRGHIEWGDSSLTELRKEKIEVNRERKRLVEEIGNLKPDPTPAPASEASKPGRGTPSAAVGSSPAPMSEVDLEEKPTPDDASEITTLTEDKEDTPTPAPSSRRGAKSDGSRPPPTRRASARVSLSREATAAAAAAAAAQQPEKPTKGKGRDKVNGTKDTKDKEKEKDNTPSSTTNTVSSSSSKSAQAEKRKLEDELSKTERRLEAIEREFRQLLGIGRARPVGKDRFYNRVWWLDGMGVGSLVASNGAVQYNTGRLFFSGPAETDLDILADRETELNKRLEEEEGELLTGEDGAVPGRRLKTGEWGYYADADSYQEFMSWLNVKGVRETALKTALNKWMEHITGGMKKRQVDTLRRADVESTSTSRRSLRAKASANQEESYLAWTNRFNIPA